MKKQVYELFIDPRTRKSVIRIAPFKHDDLEVIRELQKNEADALESGEFRYLSFDKAFLQESKKTVENMYKKKKFANIIRNYFNKKHIEFTEEESYGGSIYFKFHLDSFDKEVKIRLSDHEPNDICASLSIRYDKHNISNANIVSLLEHTLDALVSRKSFENTKKVLMRGGLQ